MATTIKHVARVAGVSVATVSRASNGHANMTTPTRAHVPRVVERLRFVRAIGDDDSS
jgi:LacI family transcriptional regulator